MTNGVTNPHSTEGMMYEESSRFYQTVSDLSADLPVPKIICQIIDLAR